MRGKPGRITEAQVHRQVADLIRLRWPKAIFNSDGAGNFTTPVQAAMATALRSSSGYPDLFVAAPRGKFHGCYIELKAPDAPLYLKSGVLSTNAHIQKQAEMLQSLTNEGYYANFAQGFEDAEKQLNWYMGQ